MQFQIPQFIEAEDKIIGPLSLKQFGYLAGGAMVSFLLFFILKTAIWFLLMVVIMGLAVSMAFVKYNGQPMQKVLANIFKYTWKPKFYLWRNPAKEIEGPKIPKIKIKKSKQKKSEKKDQGGVQVKESMPTKEKIKEAHTLEARATRTGVEEGSDTPTQAQENIHQQILEDITDENEHAQDTAPTDLKTPFQDKKSSEAIAETRENMKESYVEKSGLGTITEDVSEKTGLKGLWLKLATATKSLSKREKKSPQQLGIDSGKSKEIFELFHKSAGEKNVARRVDYR